MELAVPVINPAAVRLLPSVGNRLSRVLAVVRREQNNLCRIAVINRIRVCPEQDIGTRSQILLTDNISGQIRKKHRRGIDPVRGSVRRCQDIDPAGSVRLLRLPYNVLHLRIDRETAVLRNIRQDYNAVGDRRKAHRHRRANINPYALALLQMVHGDRVAVHTV